MMWPNSPVLLSASDANCPAHPDPVPLPAPLPDVIQEALVDLEALLEATINKISIVSYEVGALIHTYSYYI